MNEYNKLLHKIIIQDNYVSMIGWNGIWLVIGISYERMNRYYVKNQKDIMT